MRASYNCAHIVANWSYSSRISTGLGFLNLDDSAKLKPFGQAEKPVGGNTVLWDGSMEVNLVLRTVSRFQKNIFNWIYQCHINILASKFICYICCSSIVKENKILSCTNRVSESFSMDVVNNTIV